MNKLKFVVLAHLYLIRMIYNHGIDGANDFFQKDEARRIQIRAFLKAMGIEGKNYKRVMRKHAIYRLKEASVKKS